MNWAAPAALHRCSGYLGILNFQYGSVPFGNYLYTAYAQSKAPFNDIVSGTNDNLKKSTGVWSAGKGFDFLSGLGSINGTKLAAALTTAGLKPLVATAKDLVSPETVTVPQSSPISTIRHVAGTASKSKAKKKKNKSEETDNWLQFGHVEKPLVKRKGLSVC